MYDCFHSSGTSMHQQALQSELAIVIAQRYFGYDKEQHYILYDDWLYSFLPC
jgi:hypothetical protein